APWPEGGQFREPGSDREYVHRRCLKKGMHGGTQQHECDDSTKGRTGGFGLTNRKPAPCLRKRASAMISFLKTTLGPPFVRAGLIASVVFALGSAAYADLFTELATFNQSAANGTNSVSNVRQVNGLSLTGGNFSNYYSNSDASFTPGMSLAGGNIRI